MYTKFDPFDPQWDSDDEDASAASTSTSNARASSLDGDGPNGKKPKKMISKQEAIELFTQLVLEENAARAGKPMPSGAESAKERLLAKGASAVDDDTGDEGSTTYQQEWRRYFYMKRTAYLVTVRPTRQVGPASIRVGDGDADHQCALREHRVQAGCTAVVAFRVGDLLYCANAGDSRGVLCRGDGNVCS